MISQEQYQGAANLIGCDVAAIKAVHTVESRGNGFLPDGRIKILFEPHIFWQQLIYAGIDPRKHVKGNEDILYKNWQRGKYGTESMQYKKLDRAMIIHQDAALKSASWGAFQVMGFNYRACGYSSINKMTEDFNKGEYQQLVATVNYIVTSGLDDELKKLDWNRFAFFYNGPSYKGSPYTTDDDYNLKLAAAYKKNK